MNQTELIDTQQTLEVKIVKFILLLLCTTALSVTILLTIHDPVWWWAIIMVIGPVIIIDLFHLNALWLVINGYYLEPEEKKLFWLFLWKVITGAASIVYVWHLEYLIDLSAFIVITFTLVGVIVTLYQYEQGEI